MSEMEPTQYREATTQETNKPASLIPALLFLVIAVVFFTVIEPQVMHEEPQQEAVAETVVEEKIEEIQPKNFTTIPSTNWLGYKKATEDIQKLTRGQVITGDIIQDPTNESIHYFASSAYDDYLKQNLVSIYKYNTADGNFERLYRTTYAQGGTILLGEKATAEFEVIGYDNGHLIVLVKNRATQSEDCLNAWRLGMEHSDNYNLVSMDLLRPYSGFQEYNLSEEESATTVEQACK